MLRRNGLGPVSLSVQAMAWSFTPGALTDHDAVYQMQQLAVELKAHPTPLQVFEAQAAGLGV